DLGHHLLPEGRNLLRLGRKFSGVDDHHPRFGKELPGNPEEARLELFADVSVPEAPEPHPNEVVARNRDNLESALFVAAVLFALSRDHSSHEAIRIGRALPDPLANDAREPPSSLAVLSFEPSRAFAGPPGPPNTGKPLGSLKARAPLSGRSQ